jgi:N-acetylglucosamine kinase-like BadF-type ATPase
MNFLGVDVGGTKTAALIADENGYAIGYGLGGPGNHEGVGWNGFKLSVSTAVENALSNAGLTIGEIKGAGFGIAGYDWSSQKKQHLAALEEIGYEMKFDIVNDAVLGILSGTEGGWGLAVVSGTGCNCRGWSRDHKREGRVVGGASQWSGEFAGGYDILGRAMRAVSFEWTKRGPATELTKFFIKLAGAKDIDDLVEGLYVGRYQLSHGMNVFQVFKIAEDGDPEAIKVLQWAGRELGDMACGVIRQLDLQYDRFDIVLIGSIFKGHPSIGDTLMESVNQIAPGARMVHLAVPPVVGAVLLGMEQKGFDGYACRDVLIHSTDRLISSGVS